MGRILFFAVLFNVSSVLSQCAKLYVNEHISGSPICNLSSGDIIEICEDYNEVNGCPYNFYIYDKGFSNGSFTYQLSLDAGYSTHYMTLFVNPKTKKFGFLLQGQSAIYSYYSETEIAAIQAREAEQQRLANQKQAEEAAKQKKKNDELMLLDSKKYSQINALVDNRKIDEAYIEYQKLSFPSNYPREKELLEKLKIEKNKVVTDNVRRKLDSLINAKYYLTAAEFYLQLDGTFVNQSDYNKIREGLIQFYSKDTLLLENELVEKLIVKNSELLKKLSVGNYMFYFDEEGVSKSGTANLESTNIPTKTIGNHELKVGDKYAGGIIISVTESELVISSLKPIGSGNFAFAKSECEKHLLNGMPCRLPTSAELLAIFAIKNKLDSYENNWYWSSSEQGAYAEHIGLNYGDRTFVPKEHGKWIFAVRTIPINTMKIPLVSKINLTVVEKKDIVIATKYYSSGTKPIFKSNGDQYCLKTQNEATSINFVFDKSIVKNTIQVEQTLETSKLVNNVVVNRETRLNLQSFPLIKKCKSQ
jgi:hypothetical protein